MSHFAKQDFRGVRNDASHICNHPKEFTLAAGSATLLHPWFVAQRDTLIYLQDYFLMAGSSLGARTLQIAYATVQPDGTLSSPATPASYTDLLSSGLAVGTGATAGKRVDLTSLDPLFVPANSVVVIKFSASMTNMAGLDLSARISEVIR